MGPWNGPMFPVPTMIVLEQRSYASNGDRMPKLRPREIDVPIYPKRGPQFSVSSSRGRFWNVKGFPLFLNNK